MNRKSMFPLVFMSLMFVSFMVSASNNPGKTKAEPMPDNVKAIIEKSCFGCHNTDSKNDKAKEKLDFKSMNSLEKMKQIVAYKEIHEVMEKDEMPPQKFLERFPDKKVSEEEKMILMKWAQGEMEALKSK